MRYSTSWHEQVALDDGDVHVWAFNVPALLDHAMLSRETLDAEEQRRWLQLRQPADRGRFVVSHVGTRQVLSSLLNVSPPDLRFDRTCRHCGKWHGKPLVLGQQDFDFNLSHAGDWAVLGVGRQVQVGTDVEPLSAATLNREFLTRVLTPRERSGLNGLAAACRQSHVTRTWVQKEAMTKAVGLGTSLRFDSFSAPAEGVEQSSWPLFGACSVTTLLLDPLHVSAVARVSGRADAERR